MESEEWKPVPFAPYTSYYEVSNMGRVKSLTRNCVNAKGQIYKRSERLLHPQTNVKSGHQQVMLNVHGFYRQFNLHRLVAITFVPNPDNCPYVLHKDGNRANNKAQNLEWCDEFNITIRKK